MWSAPTAREALPSPRHHELIMQDENEANVVIRAIR